MSKTKSKISETANITDKSPTDDFLIAGIGGSAGSFEAFQNFLRNMPEKSGAAFVFIPHLDPTHKSLMPELLDKISPIPVVQAANKTKVLPDRVYIIPPNKTMTIENGCLRLKKPSEIRGFRLPIDVFFHSLAEDQKQNAIGVILSGSGNDGTNGIKTIKENGGIIIAQDIETAKYDSMPGSAILTGLVDFTLPVEEIPLKIIEYSKNRNISESKNSSNTEEDDVQKYILDICSLLNIKTGHDFSKYKKNTLLRRIQRRLQITQTNTISAYISFLRKNEEELNILFGDLLIGVTRFFRDKDAFESLEKNVIPKIVAGKTANDSIRVWVAGCATGEEVYSIAILIAEELKKAKLKIPVQIFSTDIDENALSKARSGIYPGSIEKDVPEEFLRNYFTLNDESYRIKTFIREMCLFSSHNLIKHPPFSKLDLVSCRNILIYLDRDLQKKILSVFHYSLYPQGFLFLGSSENIAGFSTLFATIDKNNRIFQAKLSVVETRLSFPLNNSRRYTDLSAKPVFNSPKIKELFNINKVIEHILIESFMPSCVIANKRGEVIYFFGHTGKYLEPAQGTPNSNLMSMTRQNLRLDLRTAFHKAVSAKTSITHKNVRFESDGAIHTVNIIIRPFTEPGADSDLFLVIFQDTGEAVVKKKSDEKQELTKDNLNSFQLELELRTTKEHLQTTIEELETTNDDLKSSNEELLSMNEELQSSNEEMQTSKEEMQSVNEELETVNAELKNKIEQLDAANSDLQNLFQSTDIATIFLNNNFRIKKFTPAATGIFNFIQTDIGRPITDLVPRLSNFDIRTDVENVLNSLKTIEREVKLSGENEYFIMRILPYRTVNNTIDGVVMTFVNISDIRRARIQAEQRAHQQAAIAELGLFSIHNSSLQAIFDKAVLLICEILKTEYVKVLKLDEDGKHLLMASGCGWKEGLVGKTKLDTEHNSQAGFTLRQNVPVVVEDLTTEKRFSGPKLLSDHSVRSGMSVIIYGSAKPFGVLGAHTENIKYFTKDEVNFLQSFANIIAAAVQREQSLAALRDSDQRLNLALKAGELGIWEWQIDSNELLFNDILSKLYGFDTKERRMDLEIFLQHVYKDDIEGLRKNLENCLKTGKDYYAEFRIIRKSDNQIRWLVGQGKIMAPEDGAPVKMVGINYDITENKAAQEKLSIFSKELKLRVKERTKKLNKLNKSLKIETRQRINIEEERVRLLRQLVTTQEDERSRIARDIHDQLGQQLTAIRLKLESLRNLCGDNEELCGKIDETQLIAENLDSDVSFIAWQLRPSVLDDLGLATALNDYVREWSHHYNIYAEFQTANFTNERLLPEIETNLYRIAQEALNNVSKHSGADRVEVLIEYMENVVTLIIEDNGKGFQEKTSRKSFESHGIGISGMKERAALLGGTFEIESTPSTGTTVFVRIPTELQKNKNESK